MAPDGLRQRLQHQTGPLHRTRFVSLRRLNLYAFYAVAPSRMLMSVLMRVCVHASKACGSGLLAVLPTSLFELVGDHACFNGCSMYGPHHVLSTTRYLVWSGEDGKSDLLFCFEGYTCNVVGKCPGTGAALGAVHDVLCRVAQGQVRQQGAQADLMRTPPTTA